MVAINPKQSSLFPLSYAFRMATDEKIKNLTDCSSIELKLISCKDLKAFNFFQKLSVYAVVSIFNDEMKKDEQQQHLQRQKTPVDRDGDGNPEWNHTVHFDIKDMSLVDKLDHLYVKFDMRCEGILFGKKSLGKVRVPFTDLLDEVNEAVRFLSYQVRTCDGKPNGVLNFSSKVIRKKKNKSNIGVHDSKEIGSSSESVTSVPDPADNTVQSLYPTLEVQAQNQFRDISYPSLAEVTSPLPRISVPSPEFNFHWRPESYPMSLPSTLPFTLPAAAVPAPSVHCHPCQLPPFLQTPGAYWHPAELANYGNYSFCGNPAGFGQLGMVENKGHDGWRINSPGTKSGLPVPDLGTSNGSCS
ncbi:uncharacterized protein LOC110767559 [Prunus avium]|uniref:Uncharacterized protein LOC110767559 n=1 Tax=Prunus avium TaxID=42229 RepID=A0A6P5THF7_PRUAV|nr:uncharacterized protein LOC110767559 [Prunus avium]